METLNAVSVSMASGVRGDARGAQKIRQVTVLFAEDWRSACADLFADVPWTVRRANFFVENFAHMAEVKRIGARLKIGGVHLEVTEETDPCGRMEEQVAGLKSALTPNWRGGICCKVLSDGDVEIGDKVALA